MRQREAKKYMRLAIRQAKKGLGKTGPNPVVGCVIVKDDKIVSRGSHMHFGGPHAEIVALKKAGKKAEGATCFVTLEPCTYYGKTPPCADAIIRAGIKELVCAGKDPNPLNSGRGLDILKKHNVKVATGILSREAETLNRDFFNRMKRRRPLVTLKLAQSLDGKIATRTGDSKWISSLKSRGIVQGLRKEHDAVLVGINTVLRDDPLLSVRNSKRQPCKVVVDSRLKTPLKARLLSRLSPGKVIIATTKYSSRSREAALRKKGADIIRIDGSIGKVNLSPLMNRLIQKGIGSVLVEGGGDIAASFLEKRLVDRLYLFIAPVIIGGRAAKSAVGGIGAARVKQAIGFKDVKINSVGKDFLVEAECLQA